MNDHFWDDKKKLNSFNILEFMNRCIIFAIPNKNDIHEVKLCVLRGDFAEKCIQTLLE